MFSEAAPGKWCRVRVSIPGANCSVKCLLWLKSNPSGSPHIFPKIQNEVWRAAKHDAIPLLDPNRLVVLAVQQDGIIVTVIVGNRNRRLMERTCSSLHHRHCTCCKRRGKELAVLLEQVLTANEKNTGKHRRKHGQAKYSYHGTPHIPFSITYANAVLANVRSQTYDVPHACFRWMRSAP